MKRYKIASGGQTYEVRILSDPCQREVTVEVNGERLDVVVDVLPVGVGEQPTPAGAPPGEPAREPAATSKLHTEEIARAHEDTMISAPLPGVVKSITVQPGQRVTVGDELLVIEAMKMDNAIRATREGVVRTVHVSEGHRVTHGQRLIEYNE